MEKKFTSENFEAEVLKSEKPVLVDFYADWCGPCKMMAPAVEALANEQDEVTVGKLNVDFAPELARAYKVMSIPTLILFKNGEAVEKRIGVQSKAELEDNRKGVEAHEPITGCSRSGWEPYGNLSPTRQNENERSKRKRCTEK